MTTSQNDRAMGRDEGIDPVGDDDAAVAADPESDVDTDGVPADEAELPLEADTADVLDQRRAVPIDDDERR